MKYRREIDGLRAVAVLPVILFHAGFSVFSGGYVGVDVFFVISGFLITSILIDDLEQNRFSIARFYERRARRILPALFVVMLACVPFAYMWMLPSQLEDFAQSLVAVVFFGSNILFWRETGYFAADAELKPLLHTWSLAVEEQYYLLFPLFLLMVWRDGRHRVFLAISAVALLSLLLAEWGWRNSPNANFYLAPSRAWELLAGSICAFLTVGRAQRSSNLLSVAGLVMIVFSILAFDENTPFPSVYTLVPVLGTALIILFAAQGTWVAKLLSMRGFVGIGLISYSAYLWHQPLFAFARLRSLTEPSHALMAALALAALLLAWATWYYVEQPFRKRANPVLGTRRGVFVASGAVGAAFAALGLAVHAASGTAWRGNGSAELLNVDDRLAVNHGLHFRCEGAFNPADDCHTSTSPEVLLWGDSFAMHLAPGILASEPTVGLQQHTKSVCVPIIGVATLNARYPQNWSRGCIEFNNQVRAWLDTQDSVDIVVLSSPFNQLFEDSVFLKEGEVLKDPSAEFIAEQLIATVNSIRETGARVIIVSPTARREWDIGQCMARSVLFGLDEASCDFPLDTDNPAFRLLRMVDDEVAVYWTYEDICDDQTCDVMQDGVFIYRDNGHLSKEGSAYLGRQNDWMGTFREIAN